MLSNRQQFSCLLRRHASLDAAHCLLLLEFTHIPRTPTTPQKKKKMYDVQLTVQSCFSVPYTVIRQ